MKSFEEASRTSLKDQLVATAHALSLFLLVSYLLCIGFGLLTPGIFHMHEAWAPLLPGFEWLTVKGFVAGTIGAYLYGWYIAGVYVPLKFWTTSRHNSSSE